MIIDLFFLILSFLEIFQPVNPALIHYPIVRDYSFSLLLLLLFLTRRNLKTFWANAVLWIVLTAPAVAWLRSLSKPGSWTQTFSLPRHQNPARSRSHGSKRWPLGWHQATRFWTSAGSLKPHLGLCPEWLVFGRLGGFYTHLVLLVGKQRRAFPTSLLSTLMSPNSELFIQAILVLISILLHAGLKRHKKGFLKSWRNNH